MKVDENEREEGPDRRLSATAMPRATGSRGGGREMAAEEERRVRARVRVG
jgi:hypothetical protein